MSSLRSSHRPRCGQCGSRRFRRDPNTGLVVCQEGHVLQGYREEEAQDDGEFVAASTSRRYVPSSQGRKRKLTEHRVVWTGSRASFQCYECLQLILRLQLKALRLEWPHLPPEIEALARDLWAMYVSILPRLRPAPYSENLDYLSEQFRSARQESEAKTTRRSRSRSRAASEAVSQQSMEDRQREEEEEARRMEMQIKEIEDPRADSPGADDAEDDSEEDENAAMDRKHSAARSKWRRKMAGAEPMTVLSCIIYLALVTARLPIIWADLRNLLVTNRVPFLGASKVLPSAMLANLPANELAKIEVDIVPSIQEFSLRTSRLAADLTAHFSRSVQFPELNAPPVLWRWIQDLGLPPTFYDPSLSLMTYLGIPLSVVPPESVSDPWSLLGSHETEDTKDDQKALPFLSQRFTTSFIPPTASGCTILMAALLVIVKMRYGLDGRERRDDNDSHSALAAPPINDWLQGLKTSAEECCQQSSLVVSELPAPNCMSDDQIDRYLDFAEDAILEKTQPNLRASRRRGEDLSDLFGGHSGSSERLPRIVTHPCVVPYELSRDTLAQEGVNLSGGHKRKSLLEEHAEWQQRLRDRLYPPGSLERQWQTPPPPQQRSSSKDTLGPGEGYFIPSSFSVSSDVHPDDESTTIHPTYEFVLKHAARMVGLTGHGGDEWREMGHVVTEMEKLLLRRLRKEAKVGSSSSSTGGGSSKVSEARGSAIK